MAEEDSQKIVLTGSLRIQKQWPDRLISKAFPVKIKNYKLDLGSLGRLFQNQPKIGGLWGTDIPGSTRRIKDLTKGPRAP